ncbi:glutathione S-transferase [Bordetella sp. 2513F-2]
MPDADLPILYSFRRCPYAMRARMALAASGQVCELREVVLRDKPQALLRASPKGTVPVLVEPGGKVIDESLDIMTWALQRADPHGWMVPQGAPGDGWALVAVCDDEFKFHLDRYKYPERHAGGGALAHRAEGARYLRELDDRLQRQPWLYGARPSFADAAIAPFVRQYAATDPGWFAEQSWTGLQRWLDTILGSALFAAVMRRYAPWRPGDAPALFPDGPVRANLSDPPAGTASP